jgi:hypothetical protein
MTGLLVIGALFADPPMIAPDAARRTSFAACLAPGFAYAGRPEKQPPAATKEP